MANHLKGEVEIEMPGGRKLIFRLGVNEMIRIQDALGLADDDQKFILALSTMRSFKAIRVIFHSGLLRDQPDMTEEQAGDLVTELGLPRAGEVIAQAFRWAMPDQTSERRAAKPRPSGGPTPS